MCHKKTALVWSASRQAQTQHQNWWHEISCHQTRHEFINVRVLTTQTSGEDACTTAPTHTPSHTQTETCHHLVWAHSSKNQWDSCVVFIHWCWEHIQFQSSSSMSAFSSLGPLILPRVLRLQSLSLPAIPGCLTMFSFSSTGHQVLIHQLPGLIFLCHTKLICLQLGSSVDCSQGRFTQSSRESFQTSKDLPVLVF